ncbi:hypothetical protein Bca4012_059616 [Brassica carinata]
MDITYTSCEHKYDMVSYVYHYLNLLKTINLSQSIPSLNEEFTSLMRMKFQCLDFDIEQLCDPVQFSLALSVNILTCRALSLDFGYDFGDSEAIKEMLGNFTTKNEADEGYISTEISIRDDNTIVLELYGYHERFKVCTHF